MEALLIAELCAEELEAEVITAAELPVPVDDGAVVALPVAAVEAQDTAAGRLVTPASLQKLCAYWTAAC